MYSFIATHVFLQCLTCFLTVFDICFCFHRLAYYLLVPKKISLSAFHDIFHCQHALLQRLTCFLQYWTCFLTNGCHDLFQGIISFLSEPYMISFIVRHAFLQRLTYFTVFVMHSFIAWHAFLQRKTSFIPCMPE